MAKYSCVITAFILILQVLACICSPCPDVNTTNWQVSGIQARANHERGKVVCNYNAIPFAQPPVGALRFQPPKELSTNWLGVIDGTVAKNACLVTLSFNELMKAILPQKKDHKFTISEDCLNLNVYTPNVNSSAKLPVIVWIYGGGFVVGANQQFDGAAMASMNDVVVVIPNYRVNVLGFLSFGAGSIVPGNNGLLDIIMSLNWIQNNIEDFGGDPTGVTLMGESAGSEAIGHLMNFNQASGLFHRVVAFSGVATSNSSLSTEEARVQTNNALFSQLGINNTKDEAMLMKLQKMDAQQMVDEYIKLFPRAAVIDGKIIKRHPDKLLSTSAPVPTIIISNNDEGHNVLPGLGYIGIPEYYAGVSQDNAKSIFHKIVKYLKPNAKSRVIFQKAKEHYSKQFPDDHMFYSKMLTATTADIFYHYPGFQTALDHTAKTDIYYGYGTYQLRAFHNTSYSDGLMIKPDWINCDHSDDLLVSMGMPFLDYELSGNPKFTEQEKILSERLMAYIANFAANGDPNIGLGGLPKWPTFTLDSPVVLNLGVPDMMPDHALYKHIMGFWTQSFECRLSEYNASNIVGYNNSKILLDAKFDLDPLNEYAKNRNLAVVVMQSFRKDNQTLEKSNTLVGHAITIKLKLQRKKLCGERCLKRSKRIQRFFKDLPREAGLQWENDHFSVESDAIIIHDEMHMKNPEEWEELYKMHQEYC